jgi:tetratricopeptide (TPR) repeat protein
VLVVAYSLAAAIFFVLTRFRMIVSPALFVLAGLGAVELARAVATAFRGNGRRRAVAFSIALLVCAVIVNVPVRAKIDSARYRIASTIGMPTRPETKTLGRLNLGLVLAARAKDAADGDEMLRRAEEQLRQAALEQRAADALGGTQSYGARIHVELAKVLARQHRNEEAIEEYLAAAALDPSDYRTHHGLGLLYRRTGDDAAAADAFSAALAREPRFVESAVELGEVLLQLGRPEEAERAFRHALALRPDHPEARAGVDRARGKS